MCARVGAYGRVTLTAIPGVAEGADLAETEHVSLPAVALDIRGAVILCAKLVPGPFLEPMSGRTPGSGQPLCQPVRLVGR